jgi:hypothetical protein
MKLPFVCSRNRTRVLSVLALSLLSGCDRHMHDFELGEKSIDSATMKEIETDSGVALPIGAHGLNYFYKAPIDPGFAAKIEIPAGSKDEMIATLAKIKDEELHGDGGLGERFRWWVPKNPKKLIDRQSSDGTSYIHAILTDEDARIILYLEWCVM